MTENDPDLIAKLSQQAKISALNSPRPQSPGLSPLRPETRRPQVKYTRHQIREAIKLAAEVGVKAAEQATGVKKATIYKACQDPNFGNIPESKRIVDDVFTLEYIKTPRMTTLVTAARLALYWHANMKGKGLAGKKRECFFRAADRFHLNRNVFWALYRKNLIDGVIYEP
jgi:hypothetical protein